ncbi:MAG: aldose epimerase family protein [Proteiniphilum sp.]
MGKIESEEFGRVGAQIVYLFRLVNDLGTNIEIISYGATIKSINRPDGKGKIQNIVLGYETLEDYLSDNNYIGATIGRYANRISNASFSIDGKTCFLDKNDGNNCNHGGFCGFNKKLFSHKIEKDKLVLFVESADGEGGFPGNMMLTITCQLTDKNELFVDYDVSADKKTPVNITNHSYFNLSGEKTILNHQLKIESDSVLEFDDHFLPTGNVIDVSKNPGFDFRQFKEIAKNMNLKREKIIGYNSYFIAREEKEVLKKLVTLRSEKSGSGVEVFSTMPGIMIYTGDFLSGVHLPFSGIGLEAHYYPDSPNRHHFPQKFCECDRNWKETIMYRLI